MEYRVHHSTQDQVSRDFVEALGGDPREKGEQILTLGEDTVIITGDQSVNVGLCPHISAYPGVSAMVSDGQVVFRCPSSWSAVPAWYAGEVAAAEARAAAHVPEGA